jgi:hypothetical protein
VSLATGFIAWGRLSSVCVIKIKLSRSEKNLLRGDDIVRTVSKSILVIVRSAYIWDMKEE